ncbi:phage antirepressor KilAC domain-containing protein [uncultured Sneathia sp.]|uniref:phage antirepressor KilAC domain-containing protein n=1 Tax=uncultured Sneathia sp. TaxID=278067 RepID=UPI002592D336|nr:phage antirepressor KilAC domain-containing protein [uncultured Sneathia sp.]
MKDLITKENKDAITSLELVEQINLFRGVEDDRAELQHKDLLKIIRYEFSEEIGQGKISPSSYKNSQNKEQPMYVLTFSQAKQVLVRESKAVRKAVIKYLEDLENRLRYNLPQNYTEALRQLLTQVESNQKLIAKIEEDRPRVSFAETIEKSSDSILVREFSKILANEGIHIGQNKLYQLLRYWGYIFQNSTEPTQKAVQQGLFKINERVIKSVKGDILSRTTMVTGKGQVFLLDKIKRMGFN